MVSCENCYFKGDTIDYKGDITSPFVVIGESPGILELIDKKPFLGEPGTLLDSVLNEFKDKLKIEPLFLTAINCLPKRKDGKHLNKAVECCSNRVHQTLKMHPRKVILALGNGAVWSTVGNHNLKITQIRGKVYESKLCSKGIFACVHPSYILRGGGNLQQFKRDILEAINLFNGVDLNEQQSIGEEDTRPIIRAAGNFTFLNYTLAETSEDVQEIISQLKALPKDSIVGCDFETDGFDPRKNEAHIDGKTFLNAGIICLGLSWAKDTTYVIPGHLLVDELWQTECRYAWHNGKFDIGWGRQYNMPSIRVDEDTMLMSYAMNEMGGIHDLEQVGHDWLNAPNYKNMLEVHLPSKKHSYANIPKDVLYKYQAIDTNLTYCLAELLRPKINSDDKLRRVYEEILIPATEFLHNVERVGMYVDLEQLEYNEVALNTYLHKLESEMNRISIAAADITVNPRSPKQLAKFLYDVLKLGNLDQSTDDETLQKLPDHPFVLILRKHRKAQKLVSTYIRPVKEKSVIDGLLHTTFKIHGTATGRLSSNKPNMQNIPRHPAIRGMFIANKGRAILECDLSQAELRMLAQLSGDQALARIFIEDQLSLHDAVAIEMFGKGFTKDQKVAAKCVNFGIVYGITGVGLANRISLFTGQNITVRTAEEYIAAWAARFPDAWNFIQSCRLAVNKSQTLVSAFGRRRRFSVVTQARLQGLQNEAANFPHQSGASDITLLSGIYLRPLIKEKFDANICNTVHDCLVIDLPDNISIINKCATEVLYTMQNIPKLWGLCDIPFKAEAEIGYRWGNCKSFHPGEKYENDERTIETAFGINKSICTNLLDVIDAIL